MGPRYGPYLLARALKYGPLGLEGKCWVYEGPHLRAYMKGPTEEGSVHHMVLNCRGPLRSPSISLLGDMES